MRTLRARRSWRHNPLFRPTDAAENRLTLAAVLLALLCVPLAAWLGGSVAYDQLAGDVARQHAERRQVWALVEASLPRSPADSDPESAAPPGEPYRLAATWAGPRGRERHGVVRSGVPLDRGERVRVWIDAAGRESTAPMSAGAVPAHALLAAFVAGGLAGAAVEGGRRFGVRQLDRRRAARLDEEWDRTGPGWGAADSTT